MTGLEVDGLKQVRKVLLDLVVGLLGEIDEVTDTSREDMLNGSYGCSGVDENRVGVGLRAGKDKFARGLGGKGTLYVSACTVDQNVAISSARCS